MRAHGSDTNDQKETLKAMVLTHFQTEEPIQMKSSRSDAWSRPKQFFDGKKIKWAVNKFQRYKSPGLDQNNR
jgi:hypothetical protein